MLCFSRFSEVEVLETVESVSFSRSNGGSSAPGVDFGILVRKRELFFSVHILWSYITLECFNFLVTMRGTLCLLLMSFEASYGLLELETKI